MKKDAIYIIGMVGVAIWLITLFCQVKREAAINKAEAAKEVMEAPREGEIVPICTSWAKSESHFDQGFSTNLFVVFENGAWRARFKCDKGTMSQVWGKDTPYDSPEEAERVFSINIDWRVKKAVADAFQNAFSTNSTERR